MPDPLRPGERPHGDDGLATRSQARAESLSMPVGGPPSPAGGAEGSQLTLYPPTLQDAEREGREATDAVADHADDDWLRECELVIYGFVGHHRFLPEDVVEEVERRGYSTPNRKAVGQAIKTTARQGFIRRTGNTRKSRVSHGSYKPEWERTLKGEQ